MTVHDIIVKIIDIGHVCTTTECSEITRHTQQEQSVTLTVLFVINEMQHLMD